MAALAVAGAVAGGGAGAGQRGLRAALGAGRAGGGHRQRGEQRGGRGLAMALEGSRSHVTPPPQGAQLGVQGQSARPRMGGGGQQKRKVWRRLGPAVALRAGAGAAVAVAVRRHAGVRGRQTRLRASGGRSPGAPRGSMLAAGAAAGEARGTGTRASGTPEVAVVKHRHEGGGGAQLAAELQLLHPLSQDGGHRAAQVVRGFNNCRGDTAKGQNYKATRRAKPASTCFSQECQ